MARLKILTWHVHGSYLNALTRAEHDWYVPVKRGRAPGYGGRGLTFDLPGYVREVPAEHVRDLHHLDLIICQSEKNYFEDRFEILSEAQRALPTVYIEHNSPRGHPSDTRHPIDDPNVLLVHVSHFNRLMWDNGGTPTVVIEHSVAIDEDATYRGRIAQGIVVANHLKRRARLIGFDVFQHARRALPIETVGMGSGEIGGLGDIPYRDLHRLMAEYRFLFSPMRYTSLPLAVVEAMTLGMPVVALATTAIPGVIQNGVHGYVSCDVEELIERMRALLADPSTAQRLGHNARELARSRFGLARFVRDWNDAFELALSLHPPAPASRVDPAHASPGNPAGLTRRPPVQLDARAEMKT